MQGVDKPMSGSQRQQAPDTQPRDDFTPLPCPRTIQLETTARCNLRCRMCAAKTARLGRKDMPEELFMKIIGDFAPYNDQIESLSLFMDGEPLLDKRLPRFIRAAKDAGITTVRIATNGMLLEGAMAEALLESGLDSIIVSIDSLDPKTYASIRVGGNLDRVVANVQRFMTLRAEARRVRPQVDVRMIEMPQNLHEKEPFKAFWKSIVDGVLFHGLHNWGGACPQDQEAAHGGSGPCNWASRSMVIYADGRAGFCCLDYEGIYDLGDFHTQSLMEIWHGAPYRQLREHMRHWDLSRLPKCQDCNFASIQPFEPHHWKRLLILNQRDTPERIHLEFQRPDGLTRSGARRIEAHAALPWGFHYKNDVSEAAVVDEQGARQSVAIRSTQLYYDLVLPV